MESRMVFSLGDASADSFLQMTSRHWIDMSRFSNQNLYILVWILYALAPTVSQAQVLCVEPAGASVSVSVWQQIDRYFATLLQSPGSRNKAKLIKLRAKIVMYEGEKQRLLEVVEEHLKNPNSAVVLADFSLKKIPGLLQSISVITLDLKELAQDANLFVAEPGFRDLIQTFDDKRVRIMCTIEAEATIGFTKQEVLRRVVVELRSELDAIVTAEQALAAYIRKLP
jgi:hypothetical protein